MKKAFLLIIVLSSFLGYTHKTTCNTALNATVALGSVGSLAYWAGVLWLQEQGILGSTFESPTIISRIVLDALTTGNMVYAIYQKNKDASNTTTKEADKKNTKNNSSLLKASMAISALGSAASFLFWLKPTLNVIQNYGITTAIESTLLLRLALDVLTVVATGKYILNR